MIGQSYRISDQCAQGSYEKRKKILCRVRFEKNTVIFRLVYLIYSVVTQGFSTFVHPILGREWECNNRTGFEHIGIRTKSKIYVDY